MLTDASALVALLNPHDQYHQPALNAVAKSYEDPLVTTIQCFTEATRMVSGKNVRYPDLTIYQRLESGLIQLHYPGPAEIQRAVALVRKYRDTPMSFADASLIAAAETLNQRRIFTYDSDFQIYRINDRHPVEVVG